MIDFERLQGPSGIPIYHQQLPLRTVSICWLVFVGSADDETVGEQGLFHWFEHLPSRGTRKYPGGYRDTEARLVRHGGSAEAETGTTCTTFSAHVPARVWTDALDILTDMIAQPLMRPEDVEAEREIIAREIDEWYSSPYGASLCRLPELLWPGHPLGHDQLGSHESLMRTAPEKLTIAHRQGYARSRCVLLAAGDLTGSELLDAAAERIESIPAAPLDVRRAPDVYGELPPWRAGSETLVSTEHDDSIVYLLFPVPPLARSPHRFLEIEMLESIFTAGDLGSPLNRLLRERSRLAYSPDFTCSLNPDGGYWGFVVQNSERSTAAVVDSLWTLLADPDLRTTAWHEYVRDTIRGEFDMRDPDADDYVKEAAQRLVTNGIAWSDADCRQQLLSISDDETNDLLDALSPDQAHTIIFEGQGGV